MSQTDHERQRRRHMQDQRRAQAEQAQQSAALQSGMRQEETTKNPEFLQSYTDVDLDGDLYDWLEAEFGPAVAQAHALGNRSSEYAFEQRLLNRNLAERIIAENTPGRQLRQHPKLNYLAQGCRNLPKGAEPSDDPEYRAPMTDRERRVIRGGAEVVTAHQSKSQEHMGSDAVAKVQTETTTRQDDVSEQTTATKIREGIFG